VVVLVLIFTSPVGGMARGTTMLEIVHIVRDIQIMEKAIDSLM